MLSKTILALAAIASIGTAALVTSTSSADARPGFGGFRGGFHGGNFRVSRAFTPNRIPHRPHWHPRRPHFPHWHLRWHRPYIYGGAVGVAAMAAAPAYAAVAPRPAAAPCTCLSKEYTQDGMVVFKDRCTNEAAAAPLANSQQSMAQPQQDIAPQGMPQQMPQGMPQGLPQQMPQPR